MLKKLVKFFFNLFSLEIKKSLKQNPISFSSKYEDKLNFDRWHSICSAESLNVSRQRFLSLYQSVKHIYENNVSGDLVECGVFRGGSSMMMAFCMKNFQKKNQKKKLWMYDTYEGMTNPNKYDVNILSEKANLELDKTKKIKNKKDMWAYSPLESVSQNIKKTKLNKSQYCFVKGAVEKTLKHTKPKKIALLRLDTDFYSSTRSELEYLYDLVESKGIIIIDDYGHWQGCKKAVNFFFKNKKNIFFQYIDYSALIGIKLK